jgi:hypothetical protein
MSLRPMSRPKWAIKGSLSLRFLLHLLAMQDYRLPLPTCANSPTYHHALCSVALPPPPSILRSRRCNLCPLLLPQVESTDRWLQILRENSTIPKFLNIDFFILPTAALRPWHPTESNFSNHPPVFNVGVAVATGLVVSSAEGRLPHPHRHSVDRTAPDVLRGSSSRRSKFRRSLSTSPNTSSLNRLILLRRLFLSAIEVPPVPIDRSEYVKFESTDPTPEALPLGDRSSAGPDRPLRIRQV